MNEYGRKPSCNAYGVIAPLPMFDYLQSKLRSAPVKEDAWLHRGERDESVRNVQFVSFLQQSGFRKRRLNRHEKTKRFKRFFALVTMWAVLMGFVWIAFESAQALELF